MVICTTLVPKWFNSGANFYLSTCELNWPTLLRSPCERALTERIPNHTTKFYQSRWIFWYRSFITLKECIIYLLKYGPILASFRFSSLYHCNTNYSFNFNKTNWIKLSRRAWASNHGLQDDRHRRNRGAMVAACIIYLTTYCYV